MLTILEGSLWSDLRGELYAEVRRSMACAPYSYLIVPEQQTLIAEGEIARDFPSNAPLYLEVTNFTRLANTVFRQTGGLVKDNYDKTEKMLLMWRALTEANPYLSPSMRSDVTEGSVAKALSAVGEMEKLALRAEDISQMAQDERLCTDTRLKSKLTDLALLIDTFHGMLGEGEHTDEITRAIHQTQGRGDLFLGCHFFFDGFTSFTEPQYRLLTLLCQRGEVTVTLPIPKANRDGFEYTELREAEERLRRCGREAGVDVKRKAIDGAQHTRNAYLADIGLKLWRSNDIIDNDCLQNAADSLRIFSARTPYEEASFIASDIKRRILEGAKYTDFAILARNCESYLGLIDRALERADIPYFVSQTKDVSSFEAIKLIRIAYRIVEHRFRRDDVIAYLKCGLSGVDREAADLFESYVETWQLSGDRFTDTDAWNMNPDGFTAKRRERCDELLSIIHQTRERLLSPLRRLCDSAKNEMTVREHAHALVEFLCELGMEDQLYARADQLRERGEDAAAEENERLWGVIVDTLDKVVRVVSDFTVTPATFSALLSIAFSSVIIGRLPAHSDEVTLGGANLLRLYDKKHVYLVGVNYGEFPMTVSDSSYFSEKERATLRALGYEAEPGDDVRTSKELFYFSRAFSFGTESVTLLCTEKSMQFKNTPPAAIIGRLKEKGIRVRDVAALTPEERIYTAQCAEDYLAEHPGDIDSELIRTVLARNGRRAATDFAKTSLSNRTLTLNRESVDSLYGDRLALTQSRIESFVDCPMQHFLKFALKLSTPERAEIDNRNVGTMVHAILETFFDQLRKSGESAAALTREDIGCRVQKIAESYVRSIGAKGDMLPARRAHVIERLTKGAQLVAEGLCDELSDSRYVPAYFELAIGRGETEGIDPSVIALGDGSRAYIYGVIDRVDLYREGDDAFVRVVDYKTGSKSFNVSDLKKGKNLQMFLYLRALMQSSKFRTRLGLCDSGEVIPGGVIYVQTKLDGTTESPDADGYEVLKNQQTRLGMLLNEERNLCAMNRRFLPLRFTSTGALHKSSEKLLYTREGWEDLCCEIDGVIRKIGSDMKSGYIPARPKPEGKDSPCTFCSFRPVCRQTKGQRS